MIRFAVIGTNTITDKFLQAASALPDFKLCAVYSRTLARAREYAQKNNVSLVFDSLEALANSDQIDAVYIASPNFCHAAQSILMMQHHKHVLCEKPIASNASEFKSTDEVLAVFDEFELLKHHWSSYAKSVTNYSLSAFRNAMSLGQTSVTSSDGEGVTLSTVHTMKGQQAVVVFLVGMDEGTFPDYRAIKKGNNSIEMQQEKNNLYVAITRAQRHLYICYPQKRKMPWGDWSPRKKSSLLPK